jgi:hypothetical protein
MPVSKKAYILVPDGKGDFKAVEQDGKQTGVILVGEGGTVSDELAKKYKLATDADPAPPEGGIAAPAASAPVTVADAAAAVKPAGSDSAFGADAPLISDPAK